MYYDCSQNISLKILHQFMMVRIHLNVKFVTLIVLIRVPWRVFLVLCSVTSWEYLSQMWYTWIQLLSKGLNNTIHISTVHVKSLFLKRSTWRGILHRFMRGRNPLDVRLVTQSLLKRLKWNNILNQFMRKKRLFTCTICVKTTLNEKLTHYFNFGMYYLPVCNIDVTSVDLGAQTCTSRVCGIVEEKRGFCDCGKLLTLAV